MAATVDWYFGEDEESKDSDAEVKKTVFDRPVGEQQGKGEDGRITRALSGAAKRQTCHWLCKVEN
jgi:hypothetical protein